jgi:hypothetical protein
LLYSLNFLSNQLVGKGKEMVQVGKNVAPIEAHRGACKQGAQAVANFPEASIS